MAARGSVDRLKQERRAGEASSAQSRSRAPIALALVVLVASAVLAFSLGAAGCLPGGAAAAGRGKSAPPNETFALGGKSYSLEVAHDDARREKGLGGRSSIPADGGMLFIFPDAQIRKFWMLDTLVDLDIIYVDGLGYVTAVQRMSAAPQKQDESREAYLSRLKRYPSVSRAQFAIELNAGEAEKLGIKPNQKLDLDWTRLKKLAK